MKFDRDFFKNVNYIDVGCSKGDSMIHLKPFFPNKRGIGIDIAKHKIEIATSRGLEAYLVDLFDLPQEKCVEFITMYHLLEHLTSDISTYDFMKKTVEISEDFIFIRQPYFDADKSLEKLGLKFFWSDWIGHPNKMHYREFVDIFEGFKSEGLIKDYNIFGHIPITNSTSDTIIPFNAPVDQLEYDKVKHGKKPIVHFNFLAYREIMAVARISDKNEESYRTLLNTCPQKYLIDF